MASSAAAPPRRRGTAPRAGPRCRWRRPPAVPARSCGTSRTRARALAAASSVRSSRSSASPASASNHRLWSHRRKRPLRRPSIESVLFRYQWGDSLPFCWGDHSRKAPPEGQETAGVLAAAARRRYQQYAPADLDGRARPRQPVGRQPDGRRQGPRRLGGLPLRAYHGPDAGPPAREGAGHSTTRVRDLEEQKAYVTTADDGGDYVGVSELAGAAGGGAVVDHERITGRVKFRREWLSRHGLAAG